MSKLPGFGPKQVNHCIKKNESKVVDTIDIEDMGDKVRFSKELHLVIKNFYVIAIFVILGSILSMLEKQEISILWWIP